MPQWASVRPKSSRFWGMRASEATSKMPPRPKLVLIAKRQKLFMASWPLNCRTLFTADQASPRLLNTLRTPVSTNPGVTLV